MKIKIQSTLNVIQFVMFCLFVLPLSSIAAEKLAKPNVIVILSDDQGYGDIGSHGNRIIDTPNLDQFAEQGTRFENFFVSPLCAPTRASLLTGRYHIRTGTTSVSNSLEIMREEEVTFAEVFKANGYATAAFGKWHNGEHFPNNANGQGFDEFIGFSAGHISNYFDPVLEHNSSEIETSGYITDVLTDKAMAWIEQQQDKPFLAYIPYNAPHSPYQVPDRYFDKYAAKGFDTKNAAVYGMVENMDENIGRLLAKLDQLNLTSNTIVIFLTDNGPNTPNRYNGGMKGQKGSVDEGGVRVPLFIRWPGTLASGKTVHKLAAHIDILPTLMELAGLSYPDTLAMDGISLAPLLSPLLEKKLLNKAAQWPDRMIFSHKLLTRQFKDGKVLPTEGTVRTPQYRYVLTKNEEGLYDIVNDPSQETNIKGKNRDKFKQLKAAYQHWFKPLAKGWTPAESIGVGYSAFPITHLQAVEAKLQGKLKFHGRGFSHDWIENWVDPNDAITWDINVRQAGSYQVSLDYVVPKKDIGARIRIQVGDAQVSTKVTEPFDPELYPSHDRAPRAGELEKPWKNLELGQMQLQKGEFQLVLSSDHMPGQQVIEMRRVSIRLIEP